MIRIGIYGLGKISRRVIQGVLSSNNACLYAVCSSSIEKANIFKKEYQAEKAYDNYERMLEDRNLDLVYICTPNYLHTKHIQIALSYRKHVVCEKPMCVSTKELNDCFDYAKRQNCFLMEAHKTVFTPLNQKLFEMISNEELGEIKSIDAQYATRLTEQISDWHFNQAGDGCMFDIGVYPICYANRMANSSIFRVSRFQDEALIEYENGCVAHIATSWNVDMENTAHIYGTKGSISCKNFWKNTEAAVNGSKITVVQESDFTGEIEHACTCIENGMIESPAMSRKASLEILKVIGV